MDYRGQAARIAQAYGLDPNLFSRVISAESNWNPEAVSPAGAIGLGQLLWMGIGDTLRVSLSADPVE